MPRILLTALFILALSVTGLAQNKSKDLFAAIHNNNAKKVERLLDQGADPSSVMQLGPGAQFSALTMAVNGSTLEIVKLLVEHKAQLEWKDWFKSTALMYAAAKGDLAMVELLLAHGANVLASDEQGNSVLTAAQESKNQLVIELIKDKLKN
ncbi:ankyrin repeat domain-containing protein [Hymenobacter tenuis]